MKKTKTVIYVIRDNTIAHILTYNIHTAMVTAIMQVTILYIKSCPILY